MSSQITPKHSKVESETDSHFTPEKNKNDSKVRPRDSNSFHFLVRLVSSESLWSFFFYFLMVLVTSCIDFHPSIKNFLKNH